jgi:hypothetical protein
MVVISAAVEGSIDEALVKRLISEAGGIPGEVYGKNGKLPLRARINAYNNAARYQPWIVLVDLNHEATCAPNLCRAWLPTKSPKLCFRVAVREVEAWLLADREHIANFLSISRSRVPINPESEENPKQVMVNLAALSRRRDIREDMVPRPASGRQVGPAYTSRLIEFISVSQGGWRPDIASTYSQSLQGCIECLRQLIRAEQSEPGSRLGASS